MTFHDHGIFLFVFNFILYSMTITCRFVGLDEKNLTEFLLELASVLLYHRNLPISIGTA